ncbi:Phosphotyrosine protein phosphatases I [Diplocarpon rosae]|nr:Phosphotyrosine protein phosphatases I [Diplocarpon rosae]
MASTPESISVLFVCLGNICRSTMAEGIFRSIVSKPPYQSLISVVDSCGTAAYHTGSSPDSRTMSTLEDNCITDYEHAARKACPRRPHIQESDFSKFDFIFAMDRQNLRDLQQIRPRSRGKAKVMLFGEFAGKKGVEEVDDPYYGARDGFEVAYEQCLRFSRNFLKETFSDVKA